MLLELDASPPRRRALPEAHGRVRRRPSLAGAGEAAVAEVAGPAARGPSEAEAEAGAEAAEPRGGGAAQAPEPHPDDPPGARARRARGVGVAGEMVAPEEELAPLPPRHVLQVRPWRHARRPPRRDRRHAHGHGCHALTPGSCSTAALPGVWALGSALLCLGRRARSERRSEARVASEN